MGHCRIVIGPHGEVMGVRQLLVLHGGYWSQWDSYGPWRKVVDPHGIVIDPCRTFIGAADSYIIQRSDKVFTFE